jgi:hypothetical protein
VPTPNPTEKEPEWAVFFPLAGLPDFKPYRGFDGDDVPVAIAVTPPDQALSPAVVVLVSSEHPTQARDMVSLVYNKADGALIETYRLHGANDHPAALAVGAYPGRFAVVGTVQSGSIGQILTAEYQIDQPTPLATHVLNLPNRNCLASDIVYGLKGIYIVGTVDLLQFSESILEDMVTMKYGIAGSGYVGWCHPKYAHDQAGQRRNWGKAITLREEGAATFPRVVVTGTSFSNQGHSDLLTIEYADSGPSGTAQWWGIYDGPIAGWDAEAVDVGALDVLERVYVAGRTRAPSGAWDYMILMYEAQVAGGPTSHTWPFYYGGVSASPTALDVVKPFGSPASCILTGQAWNGVSGFDYLTIRVDDHHP